MPKLKNTRGFSHHFKEILNLSDSQVYKLDELEYDKYKAYFWSLQSDQSLKFGFLRSLLNLLDSQQINALKAYKNDFIKQKKLEEERKLTHIIERERIRLKDLFLTEDQLLRYAIAKKNLPKMAEEKMKENAKNGIIKLSKSNYSEELENEHILPIFNKEQITNYLKILKKENQQELEWLHKLTKDRFEFDYDVQVADHIVSLIYEIEDYDNSYDKEGKIKSDFEQEQEKLEKYRKILNPDQFYNYLKKYNQRITQIKQNLIEINQNHLEQLQKSKTAYHYYLKNVLPEKVKVRKQLEKELTSTDKKIIDKLLKYYLQKLEINKSKALEEHQRYHKDLVPNEWEDYLIQHNFSIILPNGYLLNKHELASELLSETLIKKVKTYQSKLKSKNKRYKEFQIHLHESTGGDYGGGIIKIPAPSNASKFEYLSFLLIEPNLESILGKLTPISIVT